MASSEIVYISWLLMIFAAVVGGWGISLIIRAATKRIERVRARALEAASRPVPPHIRQKQIVGSRSAMLIGGVCVIVGCAAWFAGITIEWWLGYMPLQMLRQDMWEVSAAGLVVISLTLTATGMLFDPSKGRPRCPTCWYDVESLLRMKEDGKFVSMQCPECGRTLRKLRDTSRTRRHRVLIGVGVCVLGLSYCTLATPRVMQHGWSGLIPTTAMIAGMRYLPESLLSPSATSGAGILGTGLHTLADRAHADETWQWQRTWLQNRVRSVWESPRNVEDMLIARRVGFFGQSRMNAAQASVILEGLLSDEAVALASIQRDIPIFDAIDEEKSPAVLRGRLHDVIRAINLSSNSSTALILLAYVGPEVHSRWGEIHPLIEANFAHQNGASPFSAPGYLLTRFSGEAPQAHATAMNMLSTLEGSALEAFEMAIRRTGPMDLQEIVVARWMLVGSMKVAATDAAMVESARTLVNLRPFRNSTGELRELHTYLTGKDAALAAEVESLIQIVQAKHAK